MEMKTILLILLLLLSACAVEMQEEECLCTLGDDGYLYYSSPEEDTFFKNIEDKDVSSFGEVGLENRIDLKKGYFECQEYEHIDAIMYNITCQDIDSGEIYNYVGSSSTVNSTKYIGQKDGKCLYFLFKIDS